MKGVNTMKTTIKTAIKQALPMSAITAPLAIAGVIFFIIGINQEIPDHRIWWAKEYVGGDAYNYIIEASIRGGEIAGAMVTKAIYIVFGSFLEILSISLSIFHSMRKETTKEAPPQEEITEPDTIKDTYSEIEDNSSEIKYLKNRFSIK